MQIVIEIDEDYYIRIKKVVDDNVVDAEPWTNIANGTPIPKGHGRLIDAAQLEKDSGELWNCDFIHPIYDDTLSELINNAPTIIEAQAEGED